MNHHKFQLIFVSIIICFVLSSCGNKAEIPLSAENYLGTNYAQTIESLESIGFSNIAVDELADLVPDSPLADGSIDSISINGNASFQSGEKYPKDAEIHIVYHSMKKISPPFASDDLSQYDSVHAKEAFEIAGFSQIKVISVEDLTSDTRDKEGSLLSIKIGDSESFDGSSQFSCDSVVSISYHALKMVNIPLSTVDVSNFSFSDINSKLKSAGFSNINSTAIEDLNSESAMKDETITEMLIMGESEFESGILVPHDAEIKITYHMIKKAQIPFSAEEIKSLPYVEVENKLKNAGFSNVNTTEIFDLDPDETQSQYVNEVTINGETSYTKFNIYPFDVPVVITSHRPYEKYTISAHVACDENWFFSKYDVNVLFDGNKIATLSHGMSADYTFRAKGGSHTIEFVNKDDSAVKGTTTINVTVDTEISYQIHCNSTTVQISTLWEDKKIQLAADEIKMQTAASVYRSKNYNEVVNELTAVGFSNISVKAIHDLTGGWFEEPDGRIDSISINGQSDFVPNDVFKKDSPVVIIYHTLKLSTSEIQSKIDNGVGQPANDALASFEETSYKVVCSVAGEEIVDFRAEGYILEDGHLDTDKEIAYLAFTTAAQVELKSQLEETFPQVMAKRAAVVALTNSQAEDVFKSDGNSYDVSKFHSYSDISGFFMILEDEGTWSAKDSSTWHVYDIRLKIYGYETYVKANLDVTQNGNSYIVSNVDKVCGAKGKIDDGKTYATEHMEPSGSHPYLTVPSSLVEVDRDDSAVQAMIDAKKAHDDWVNGQFSIWNGSHNQLESLIKSQLNNESSYKHIETTYAVITDSSKKSDINNILKNAGYSQRVEIDDVFIITQFSAKNAFNATIKYTAIGIASYSTNKIILVGIE